MDHKSAFNQLSQILKKSLKITWVTKKVTVFQAGFDTILNEKAFKHYCLKAFYF